jgi:hypothetical protein
VFGCFDSETADDMAKNSHLKDLQALGPLEVFRADLDEEGSFDDAVAGCDYAFLVAAPVNLKSDNPQVPYRLCGPLAQKKIFSSVFVYLQPFTVANLTIYFFSSKKS